MDFDITDIVSSVQTFVARLGDTPLWAVAGASILIAIIICYVLEKAIAWMVSSRQSASKNRSSTTQNGDTPEDYTAQIVEISVQALAFIQMQIDGDPDKRHQKIYKKHSAKRPISRISALYELRRISDQQEQALRTILRLAERFNKNRTGARGAPLAVYELVKSNWASVQPNDD